MRVGNGVSEFLYAIPRGLRPRRVVMPAPCSTDYWRASDYAGAESEGVLSSEAKEFALDPAQIEMRLSGTDMVFLGNPSDPTGVAAPADAIRATGEEILRRRLRGGRIVRGVRAWNRSARRCWARRCRRT